MELINQFKLRNHSFYKDKNGNNSKNINPYNSIIIIMKVIITAFKRMNIIIKRYINNKIELIIFSL